LVPGLYSDAPKRNLIVLLLYLWLLVALLPLVL
jgi:hypothetical protein